VFLISETFFFDVRVGIWGIDPLFKIPYAAFIWNVPTGLQGRLSTGHLAYCVFLVRISSNRSKFIPNFRDPKSPFELVLNK
jgi:hypothetical protein